MRALLCGSRRWAKAQPVAVLVAGLAALYADDLVVIHGAARGADTMAATAAGRHGVLTEACPADWTTHGRAAGPIRNQHMLTEGRPDVVFAFTDNLRASRGTADMAARARRAGIPVYVIARLP